MVARIFLVLCFLVSPLLLGGWVTDSPRLLATLTLKPGDLIVDDEAPNCPVGGPIYRISGGQVSVIAQGNAQGVPLGKPRGSILDAQGNLVVADGFGSGGLRRVDLTTGAVTTIAANPPYSPRDVAIDSEGNFIAVGYDQNAPGGAKAAIYKVTPAGQVTVIAQDSPFHQPHGLDIDTAGNYIVADAGAGVIRVTPQGTRTIVRGVGPGTGLGAPPDLRVDPNGDYIVADGTGAVVKVRPDGSISIIHRGAPFSSPQGPRGIIIDSNGNYLVVDEAARAIFRVTPSGNVTTVFSGAPLCGPADLLMYQLPKPTLLAPASGTALNGLGTTLTWSNPAGTTQYQLQVIPAKNDGPGINIIRNAETSFVVEAPKLGAGPYVMLPGMTYSWRVRTNTSTAGLDENSPDWGPWASGTFKTPAPSSAKIEAVQPQPGASVSAPTAVLQWSNAATDIFYYELQVSPDPKFGEGGAVSFVWQNLIHGGVTTPSNSWTTPPLIPGLTYFWRVRPRVQGDGTPVAWSPTWSFKS